MKVGYPARVKQLFFLGVGTIASVLRSELPELPAAGTTRGLPDARFSNITPIPTSDAHAIEAAARGAHVLVSFPPDGQSDREWSALLTGAASTVYLSSTAVYPDQAGTVNETSAVSASGERALLRLAAEALWLAQGASVVRLPAFYGPATGLHRSIARRTFRMPGEGTNIVSRVHVADAAHFVRAAWLAPPGSLLLAGDDEPASVAEVVAFVCDLFSLPLPEASEGADIPLSLRASRRVDNRVTKASFGIQLEFPTYREGYRAIYEGRGAGPS